MEPSEPQIPPGGNGSDAEPSDHPAPPAETGDTRPVIIHIKNLTKSYDGKIALQSLDLQIPKGDIFGYIGPNGAGKTTTLRILAALLWPSRGSAEIAGVDVVKKPRRIKELVGYMPDAFGVYDNRTLYEYLDFFGAAYRISRSKRRKVIDDVLALTDLGSKRDDQVSAFSRGMKQRACLAKTLLHNPQVLILDEPASGLDPRARIELRELLKELQKMGKTILVSSHILSELSSICNSVGIIEAGKLVTSGEVKDILKSLKTNREFTLDLLDWNDSDRAQELLEKQGIIQNVEAVGASLRFTLQATEPEIAALLELLIREEIRLTSFR